MKNKLGNLNCFEEESCCARCQECPFTEEYDLDDDGDACEDCPCFNDGFDMGFKHGQKVAREELEDDIYINGYKIDRIDDLRQKVITLGHHIPFEHREAIDEILEDLTSLIKDEAMEAVNDYLGYR